MATSSGRMNWPIPDYETDPWYSGFVSMVDAQDASGYASREDRGILLMGGGQFNFNATTGIVTWAADIQILAPVTGFYWTVPGPATPGGGTITLQDGQIFFVNVVRAPSGNIALPPQVAFQVPDSDSYYLIAIRRGSLMYFRNGAVLLAGTPASVIDSPFGATLVQVEQAGALVGSQPTLNFATGATVVNNPGQNRIDISITGGGGGNFRVYERGVQYPQESGLNFQSGVCNFVDNPGQNRTDISILGTTGQSIFTTVTMATNEATYQSTVQLAGSYSLAPQNWGLDSMSGYTFNFTALGAVTSNSLTGNVLLYDLTAMAQVGSTQTFTSTTPTKVSFNTGISESNAEHIYEVRFYVTGGSSNSDQIILSWAGFEILQTL